MFKSMTRAACIYLAIGLLPTTVALAEVEISSQPLTDNIFLISGEGGNIGLFTGADGSFVIDDKFAPLSDAIMAEIKKRGGEAPKYLLNTHFHFDHTGGNQHFAEQGAIIISQHNVRERMLQGTYISTFKLTTPPAKPAALPVISYSKNMHLHLNGEKINITHIANAHTDGDSVIQFTNANIMHTGDLFFNGFYPFIDTEHGGSLKGMIAASETIINMIDSDTKIIPGHGPIGDLKDLQAFHKMLISAYNSLSALKAKGLSAEQAIEIKPLQALEEQWGKGFFNTNAWITIVYPNL